jgi:hypothetical protein
MDPCVLFLLEDSSSSSDDSNLEELLDNDVEQTTVILAKKEILDVRPKKRKGLRGQPWGGCASPRTAVLGTIFSCGKK